MHAYINLHPRDKTTSCWVRGLFKMGERVVRGEPIGQGGTEEGVSFALYYCITLQSLKK